MRLKITHVTSYHYAQPVGYALQQLRLTPKSRAGQRVAFWNTKITGGRRQVEFDDAHMNHVQLISFDPDASTITVESSGEIEMSETHGIVGVHSGFMPLWMFLRPTNLTRPGPNIRKFLREFDRLDKDLPTLHALSAAILEGVSYETGQTNSTTSAEASLEAGKGVCQDHAHIFLACARQLGFPARYVSGYLMLDDRVDQGATHAWAEAHIEGLGWVGFDVSNAISPDMRYVRVATGLDYAEAAPVSGLVFDAGEEELRVTVQVQQVQQQ